MRILLAALATLVALSGAASALGSGEDDIAIYGGYYSLRGEDTESGLGGIEYRYRDQFNGLRPTVGVFVNGDGATYGYAGAYWDLPLNTAPFVISPGFAVGAYGQGDSKDLGDVLEFRSTIEVAYKTQSGQKFGVQLSHLSNASLGRINPGVETLQAVYSHPF